MHFKTCIIPLVWISGLVLGTAVPGSHKSDRHQEHHRPHDVIIARTRPPPGAIIVRANNTHSGEFATVQSAVDSLPNDATARSIFIFPGVYAEQVLITRPGNLTIFGYTHNTRNFSDNTVVITHALSAGQINGSDDATGTLRVHKDNFSLYNVNLQNTFGPHPPSGGQALALSASGTNHGYYAVGFFGFQDTVLAQQGNQFYGHSYIEGAVDFIFGQHARAFFHKNTIASISQGAITADGPTSATDASLFVINRSKITTSAAATTNLTGRVFLGRPWTQFAHVAYTHCDLGALINSAGWEQWNAATPNTQNVTFAEFNNTGPGAQGVRAPFATELTSEDGFRIGDVLGSNWEAWVDKEFL